MTIFGATEIPKDKNLLMRGDNLAWLKRMESCSVDMVYKDPPFNSDRTYNMTFDGDLAHLNAQIVAFDDTWIWTPAVEEDFRNDVLALDAVTRWNGNDDVIDLLTHWYKRLIQKKGAVRKVDQVKREALMAYLYAMAPRLMESHRVLRPGGAMYVHCDDNAGAYLRQLMDSIFGETQYRNEIIWKRTGAHKVGNKYARVHDVILYYVKAGGVETWNQVYTPYDPEYIKEAYNKDDGDGRGPYQSVSLTGGSTGTNNGLSKQPWRGIHPPQGRNWSVPQVESVQSIVNGLTTQDAFDALDAAGRILWPKKPGGMPRFKRYLSDGKGVAVQDIITDIRPISSGAAERLGYPTQKPISLLERLITISTNEGDTVLDPFAGCFTTIEAAWRLKRRFIGIDIAWQGVKLAEDRLVKAGAVKKTDFLTLVDWAIHEVGAYERLAEDDKRVFQDMVLTYALGKEHVVVPNLSRGADGGWDGYVPFWRADKEKGKVLVSVKGGKKSALDVDSLIGVVHREGVGMGLLIQLEKPTKEQALRAKAAGFIVGADGERVDRVQIATIDDLIDDDPRTGLVLPSNPNDLPALF